MLNQRISTALWTVCIHVTAASALATRQPSHITTRSAYPFTHMVAYGDELSDNGNGSYAHGITGNPATVYGYGTWTNGPVAVSYLTDLLGTPLRDYAYGGCCGGASFGATIDNDYTKSQADAPSLQDQIHNYTTRHNSGVPSGIKDSLQFIWVGQNDLSEHTDAFWGGDPHNTWFANNISSTLSASVSKLLDDGAKYVFVVGLYPKHIAPVTAHYLCGSDTSCVTTWGQVIQQANQEIKSSLSKLSGNVIYYDIFDFMVNLTNDAVANGFTQPLTSFCDGDGDAMWNLCMVQGKASEFFWMNFIQPTTRVHEMIAHDMKKTIDAYLGA